MHEKLRIVGKIAFGKNASGVPQEWYILERDSKISGDNVVLFATQSIKDNQNFYGTGYIESESHTYESDWKCEYTDGTPSGVSTNHYGGSDLRAFFKDAEKNTKN